ncbi:migration and invasion enhancer 1-like [Styela clava]
MVYGPTDVWYDARFEELKSEIQSSCSGLDISGFEGREGSFEVSVNEELVFSKLKTYGFPYSKDIIEAVKKAQMGEKVSEVTNSQSPCNIL